MIHSYMLGIISHHFRFLNHHPKNFPTQISFFAHGYVSYLLEGLEKEEDPAGTGCRGILAACGRGQHQARDYRTDDIYWTAQCVWKLLGVILTQEKTIARLFFTIGSWNILCGNQKYVKINHLISFIGRFLLVLTSR